MPSTFTNLLCHVVFTTKDRIPRIHDGIRERLYEYIGGIIRKEGGVLLQIGGMPDHVHLLIKMKTDITIPTMVRLIKARSSKWVNERGLLEERFEWQAGYGAFSVSESQAARVRRYIQEQESHHRRVSFKDELIALLKKNRIDYDERYLLG